MRRSSLLPILCLAAACQPLAEGPTAAPEAPEIQAAVRLATWNLEHLAERNGTGCRPRTEADYQALRAHAERLNADVVALQEVESVRAAHRVFPETQWTVVLSQRPGSGRPEACREAAGEMIRRQDVGFAIRRGIPFRQNPDVRALGVGHPDLRWGVDITLNLPRPIRLLAIHLKSGCNAGRNPSDGDCSIIFQQGEAIEAWIEARAWEGEDFAVLGDWNRRTGLSDDEFLPMISDNDPPGARLVMADAGMRAACIARFRDYIDHIGLGETAARRMIAGSFAEYAYGGIPEEQFPSDHCPSKVSLQRR